MGGQTNWKELKGNKTKAKVQQFSGSYFNNEGLLLRQRMAGTVMNEKILLPDQNNSQNKPW